ncbi:MAG: glycosyltransferase [Acidobacteria bacterium]|nr:glycosyltransferase [Acidobacteriota bacterium]
MTRGLIEQGIDVSLMELCGPEPVTWLSETPHAKYFDLAVPNRAAYPVAVWKIARLLRRERVDILHTHLFNPSLLGTLSKRFAPSTTFVMTRHHTSGVRMLGTRFHVALDKWMVKKADAAVTVSEAARRYMLDVDHIDRNDIEVIPLGFDFDIYAPDATARKLIRSEMGFRDDELIVGYVANFAPGKGHQQLIEAFQMLAREMPQARLFLVGSGDTGNVQEIVERFGLRTSVVFAGRRRDIPACLNAMDIFVQPSLSEAFSQVLIEAMGVGLPVIATKVGSAGEIFRPGESGLLVPPDDPYEIFLALRELLADKLRTCEMADAGRSFVREHFRPQQMVDKHVALYRRLMRSN